MVAFQGFAEQNLGVLRFEATGMLLYNITSVAGDRARQECERLQTPNLAFGDLDPCTVAAPNGMGLVSYLVPTLYDHAGGFNALNSSPPAAGCKSNTINHFFRMRTINI